MGEKREQNYLVGNFTVGKKKCKIGWFFEGVVQWVVQY